jgi:hypothetical protein
VYITAAGTATATLVVTNKGPGSATAVRAAVSIPAGLTVVNANGGTVRGSTVTFTAATLESGKSATYTIVLRAQAGGRGARLLAAAAASQVRDPALLNNVTVRRVLLA